MKLALRPYVLPLARPVRGRVTRRGWLLGLERGGAQGWGEAACWPGFGAGVRATRDALRALAADRRPLTNALDAAEAADLEGVAAALAGVAAPAARHAAEVAALDLAGRRRGAPLANTLAGGALPRPAVPVHALVSDARDVYAAPGPNFRAVKVKLGSGSSDLARADLRRVTELRAAIGPVARLRLDCNGQWSVEEALARLPALAELGIDFVEQPVARGDVEGLARVRREAKVAVAVDEGVSTLDELLVHTRARALDVLVIKPQAVGGLVPARALARRARAEGLRVVITHLLDAAVARAAALALAAALPDDGPHGLAPALAKDVAALPPVEAGRAPLPVGAGLGLTLDEDLQGGTTWS